MTSQGLDSVLRCRFGVPGTTEVVDIEETSNTTASTLLRGKVYRVAATVNCFFALGDEATADDIPLIAFQSEFIIAPTTVDVELSVIRASDDDGKLHITRYMAP